MKRTSILIAGIVLASQGTAAEPQRDDGQQLVDSFVTEVITLSGRFEQSLIDAEGRVLETTRGTLEIQRPGRFRWAYTEPYEQWLIADGLNIWSYDVDLEQVTVKPQADALANTPALLLGGSDAAMDQFEYEGSSEENGLTWVRLLPVNTESGFRKVELGFDNERLSRMVFFDNLEQTTFVALDDVAVNEPIEPERFAFAIPDGVDVIGQPANIESTDQ